MERLPIDIGLRRTAPEGGSATSWRRNLYIDVKLSKAGQTISESYLTAPDVVLPPDARAGIYPVDV